MSIRDSYNSVSRNLLGYSQIGNLPTTVHICKIQKVYEENLTADIFIPKTATTLLQVPLCFNFKDAHSGGIFMPSEGSTALVLRSTEGKFFIICSATFSKDNKSAMNILKNENVIFTPNTFFKQDNTGNQIFSSSFSSTSIIGSDGRMSNYHSNEILSNVSMKKISGVTKVPSDNGVKVMSYEKHYTDAVYSSNVYNKSDIVSVTNTTLTVNNTIREEILSSCSQMLDKVKNFFKDMRSFRDTLSLRSNLSPQEASDIVSQTSIKLYNDYSIKKTASLIIEKGCAINKDINSAADLENIKIEDIDVSQSGKNIVFRLTVKSPTTGLPVARISIDEEGLLKIQSKNYNL